MDMGIDMAAQDLTLDTRHWLFMYKDTTRAFAVCDFHPKSPCCCCVVAPLSSIKPTMDDPPATEVSNSREKEQDEDYQEGEATSDEEEDNEVWIEHSTGTHHVWRHFLRSALKKGRTNRYTAKCNYCGTVLDGKVQRMLRHAVNVCKKISFDCRASVLKADVSGREKKQKMDKSTEINKSPSTLGSASVNSNTADSAWFKSRSIRAFYEPAKLSDAEEQRLNDMFLRAIVSGGVPFKFAENFYLNKFLATLKPATHKGVLVRCPIPFSA